MRCGDVLRRERVDCCDAVRIWDVQPEQWSECLQLVCCGAVPEPDWAGELCCLRCGDVLRRKRVDCGDSVPVWDVQ